MAHSEKDSWLCQAAVLNVWPGGVKYRPMRHTWGDILTPDSDLVSKCSLPACVRLPWLLAGLCFLYHNPSVVAPLAAPNLTLAPTAVRRRSRCYCTSHISFSEPGAECYKLQLIVEG